MRIMDASVVLTDDCGVKVEITADSFMDDYGNFADTVDWVAELAGFSMDSSVVVDMCEQYHNDWFAIDSVKASKPERIPAEGGDDPAYDRFVKAYEDCKRYLYYAGSDDNIATQMLTEYLHDEWDDDANSKIGEVAEMLADALNGIQRGVDCDFYRWVRDVKHTDDKFTYADLYKMVNLRETDAEPTPSWVRVPHDADPDDEEDDREIHSYWEISPSDALRLRLVARVPIFHDRENDLWYYGKTFCNVSPSDVNAKGVLTDDGWKMLFNE